MNSLETYPRGPGWKRTDTSKAAAEGMASEAGTIRALVLETLTGLMPMTADEMARHLRIDRLSVRPRFSELRESGEIFDTGARRPNDSRKLAIVWDAKNA